MSKCNLCGAELNYVAVVCDNCEDTRPVEARAAIMAAEAGDCDEDLAGFCEACADPIHIRDKLCLGCKSLKARGICPYCHGQPDDESCHICGTPSQAEQDMANDDMRNNFL